MILNRSLGFRHLLCFGIQAFTQQHFSESQHGSTGATSSADTNLSSAEVRGIALHFSSHRIWPPNFPAQYPVILMALSFFQDNTSLPLHSSENIPNVVIFHL